MLSYSLNKEVDKDDPDIDRIKNILSRCTHTSYLDDADSDGRTAFMQAARRGTDQHLTVMHCIMNRYRDRCEKYFRNQLAAPLKHKDNFGWNAFMHAAHGGHLNTLQYVYNLHKSEKVEILKSAIDTKNVTGAVATGFVANKVFGGSMRDFLAHTPSKKSGRSHSPAVVAASASTAASAGSTEAGRTSSALVEAAAEAAAAAALRAALGVRNISDASSSSTNRTAGASSLTSSSAAAVPNGGNNGNQGDGNQQDPNHSGGQLRVKTDGGGDGNDKEAQELEHERKERQRLAQQQLQRQQLQQHQLQRQQLLLQRARNNYVDNMESQRSVASNEISDDDIAMKVETDTEDAEGATKVSSSSSSSSGGGSSRKRRSAPVQHRPQPLPTSRSPDTAAAAQSQAWRAERKRLRRQTEEANKERDEAIKQRDEEIKAREELERELQKCRAELEFKNKSMKTIGAMMQSVKHLLPDVEAN